MSVWWEWLAGHLKRLWDRPTHQWCPSPLHLVRAFQCPIAACSDQLVSLSAFGVAQEGELGVCSDLMPSPPRNDPRCAKWPEPIALYRWWVQSLDLADPWPRRRKTFCRDQTRVCQFEMDEGRWGVFRWTGRCMLTSWHPTFHARQRPKWTSFRYSVGYYSVLISRN